MVVSNKTFKVIFIRRVLVWEIQRGGNDTPLKKTKPDYVDITLKAVDAKLCRYYQQNEKYVKGRLIWESSAGDYRDNASCYQRDTPVRGVMKLIERMANFIG